MGIVIKCKGEGELGDGEGGVGYSGRGHTLSSVGEEWRCGGEGEQGREGEQDILEQRKIMKAR